MIGSVIGCESSQINSTVEAGADIVPGSPKVDVACSPSCPAGYACSATGVCTGGSPSNLVLDIKTINVAGKVTFNGATPVLGQSCPGSHQSATVTLLFTEVSTGYSHSISALCSDSTFSFSGVLYPGTYLVRGGNTLGSLFSNIPFQNDLPHGYVVSKALALTANTSGLVFDIQTVNIAGKVTLNGATPVLGQSCPGSQQSVTATAQFTEVTYGYGRSVSALCSDSTYSFSGAMYPGTYVVRIGNTLGSLFSNIPFQSDLTQAYVVAGEIQIP